MKRVQRKILLEVTAIHRTISIKALQVITSIPIKLQVKEQDFLHYE